jgi:catechol-2,3-dioxygenase
MIDEDERVESSIIAHAFADDYLLVAENDYDTYRYLLDMEGNSISTISDTLREEWEELVEQVVELVEEKISPTASLFIAQLLQGQGVYPFDIIARRVLELKEGVSSAIS